MTNREEKAGGGEPKFNMGECGKTAEKSGGLDRFLYYLLRIRILYQHLLFQSLSDRVIGVSPESSGFISIVRNYLLLLLAPVGGIIADKIFKSTCNGSTTAFIILAALFGAVLILPSGISPMQPACILIPGAFAMMMYGVVFSTVSEAGIPDES